MLVLVNKQTSIVATGLQYPAKGGVVTKKSAHLT